MNRLGKAISLKLLSGTVDAPIALITTVAKEAKQLKEALEFVSKDNKSDEIIYFPPYEILPYEQLAPAAFISFSRIRAFKILAEKERSGESYILVTSIEAIGRKVGRLSQFDKGVIEIKVTDELDSHSFFEMLIATGYERVGMVANVGEFSSRGSIIDIFCANYLNPIRIELNGDEIESIRMINSTTQRSIRFIDNIAIYPLREINYIDSSPDQIIDRLGGLVNQDKFAVIKEKIERQEIFDGIESYLPIFHDRLDFLFDLLSPKLLKVLDESMLIREHIEDFYQTIERIENDSGEDEQVSSKLLFVPKDELLSSLDQNIFMELGKVDFGEAKLPYHISSSGIEKLNGNLSEFESRLRSYIKGGYLILIVAASESSRLKLKELLDDFELAIPISFTDDIPALIETKFSSKVRHDLGTLLIGIGRIDEGSVFNEDKTVFITESEIFKKRYVRKGRSAKFSKALKVGVGQLEYGDYVVHQDYGIGRYLKSKMMEVNGSSDEYLELEYRDAAHLFVPIYNISLIKKYQNVSKGKALELDKLGSLEWSRIRSRIRKNLFEMAGKLVKLEASRKLARGIQFSKETTFHKEFAEEFEHQETDGQEEALKEIFSDMESSKPMDRLLLGDVGYGKTEVAMRGAFKAVYDKKQVALLVPTTILASQHYESFKLRFKKWGMRVELLSRVHSGKKSKEILADLALGKIDIIIGTHKLLNESILFKDLGLLIIDEEQKFGVKAKEIARKFVKQGDILTLSATPIPRTLYSTLVNIRDISLIETPPPSRHAIKNFIGKFSEEIVQEAIERELDRGGQLFFVNNRISDLDQIMDRLQKIASRARIIVAHGQMTQESLSSNVRKFVEQEVDILLTTTIIDSGLDIPNANTIIINRSDRYGLAQLYQLRGRVGRKQQRAYCYFLIDDESALSEKGTERLEAIEELSELGSGFKLARRDLEIRGFGNLLGAEQSGHIDAVGFDTYCKMLGEEIKRAEGEKVGDGNEVIMKIGIGGKLEPSYIPDLKDRFAIYEELSEIASYELLDEFKEEITDRFGKLPVEARKLFLKVRIRLLLNELSVSKIESVKDRIRLQFENNSKVEASDLIKAANSELGMIKFISQNSVELTISQRDWEVKYGKLTKWLLDLI
ncbi:MAG: transcription-repair coupling factor [Nitrospinota bacterium]